MASKKDLVEAHAFSRRRLVSAFLSGAPGGREVEPARPGRTVFGGAVMAILLVAGGAVAHFLHPAAATDWWTQNGLVITKGGARYVVVGPDKKKELHAVANLTSAQLILGLDLESKSKVISQDDISNRHPKWTLGIANAPEQLPTKDQFIKTGWTACTDDGKGTYASISARPAVSPGSGKAVLAQTSQSTYMITEGMSASGQPEAFSYDLGAASTYTTALFNGAPPPAINVPQSWVNLFPKGSSVDLDAFGIKDFGQQYKGPDAQANWTVGTIGNNQGTNFLLTDQGWARLTSFEFGVYQAATSLAHESFATIGLSATPSTTGRLPTVTWPTETPTAAQGAVCAQLETKGGTTVRLATSPRKAAWPTNPTQQPAVDAGPRASIDAGKGAFVYVGTGTNPASDDPFIIDSSGQAYKLDGPKTVSTLGLSAKSGPIIPPAWLLMFPTGDTALSTEMALCPPSTTKVQESKCVAAGSE